MAYTKHLPKVLSEEEVGDIVESIQKSKSYAQTPMGDFLKCRDITIILLMFYCGLRPAECLELKWEDLDFAKRLIKVRPYINHQRKNDLPAIMTIPAERIIKRYKEAFAKIGVRSEFMFPSVWTWRPLRSDSFAKRYLNILKEAGMANVEYYTTSGQPKYSTRLYDLRHSFATKIYKKTGSEIAVSRLCRHTQVQSASIYTHLNFEDKKQIADNVFN